MGSWVVSDFFTAQKMKFPIKDFFSSGFGHIYWKNPLWKTSFFVQYLMPFSVQQWRVEIRTFSCRYILRFPQSCKFFMKGKTVAVEFAFIFLLNFSVILYFCYILLSHGDVEVNPRPKQNCSTSFSFSHWNLNSLTVHN